MAGYDARSDKWTTRGVDVTGRLVGLLHGPASITLVRHGESLGNLADAEARRQESDRLDLKQRDADVELSDTGQSQADALRAHLESLSEDERPTVVVSSPYARAAGTAQAALASYDVEILLDERLRERDLGQFDGLTGKGIRHLHADEAERRDQGRQVLLPAARRGELGGRRAAGPVAARRPPAGLRGRAGVDVHPPGGDHGASATSWRGSRRPSCSRSTGTRRSRTAR